ncbi:MAG: hypothetical protein AB1571_02655 [Nanoarchaeota archaeon]
MDNIKEIRKKILNKITNHYKKIRGYPKFRILVWGPGNLHPYGNLRERLITGLKGEFNNVYKSEELELPEKLEDWLSETKNKMLEKLKNLINTQESETVALQERFHGELFDLIFIIPISPGSRLELILFSAFDEIRNKFYAIIPPMKYNGSFIERVANLVLKGIRKKEFLQEEYNENNLISHCLQTAKDIYHSKYIAG